MNKNILKYIIFILIIGITVFIVTKFFFQIAFVNGDSMLPTYKSGQIVFIKKNINSISKDDIIIGRKNGITFIKRVVGVPNDKLIIKDGKLYINDKIYDKYKDIENGGILNNLLVLKENEYFIMGDNVNHSSDSRENKIGIINKENIFGIVIQ